MQRISNDLNEIKRKLARNPHHKGLQYAYTSGKNKRSPCVASILLVGLTGAGKSSTLNMLFNNKNLADVGDSCSCSSDIIEYEVQVPVRELDVENTVLRIIDTPGFGDTRDSDFDARLIATLKHYFESHKDFASEQVPTVVLITAGFTDNRFEGETSAFVKMLKGLKSMEKSIFDVQNSNTMLLLTHFMSGKPSERKHPENKCSSIGAVLHQFINLPKPIITILAENEAVDFELPKQNGYFKLPNGEFYPYNLFQAIQTLTTKSGDVMGETIIRTAFKDIKAFEIQKRKIELLKVGSQLVNSATEVMNRITFNITKTEIADKLYSCWNNMSSSERNDCPGTLECIQRVFERKGICTMAQLPKTESEILNLMKEIPSNYVVPKLLEQALGIKVPKLNFSPVVGYCYSIINDCTIPASIFNLGTTYILSPIGYMMPSEFVCDVCSETKDACQFFNSDNEYINARLSDLNVIGQVNANAFKFNINVRAAKGYNIINKNAERHVNTTFTSLREYRQFRLTLASDIELNSDFVSAIQRLPKFELNNSNSVAQFTEFFQRFGTHVVTSCFGGGAIEIEASVENANTTINMQDLRSLVGQLKAGFSDKFRLEVDATYTNGYQYTSRRDLTNIHYSTSFKGGDIMFHLQNPDGNSHETVIEYKRKWIESLTTQPVMLNTDMKIVPVSYYVRQKNQNTAENIDLASQKLFEANLKYTAPPPPPPPPPRLEVQAPSQPSSGCLKAGTLIMLSDGRKLPIEIIRSGDMVLDINLKPCRVIGVNHMFMDGKNLYGFSKNNCFFTGGHIFVQNKSNDFFVISRQELLKDNPFMDKLNIIEVQSGQSIEVMKLKDESGMQNIVCETVTIFKDETEYDAAVPVYFLIVESATGTYIANDYVCRHELPTFECWPNTLVCLQKIFTSNVVKQNSIGKKLSPSELCQIEKIADYAAKQLKKEFLPKHGTFFNDITNTEHDSTATELIVSEMSLYLTTLLEMTHDNYWSAFGMLIYGRCGYLIRDLLDNQKKKPVSSSILADFIIKSIENFYTNTLLRVRDGDINM
ncbi:hypothetical protein I4U23_005057 [Adineta vaga]|nr:hypothetical protein I4U23_005057 [Adineta vaga]